MYSFYILQLPVSTEPDDSLGLCRDRLGWLGRFRRHGRGFLGRGRCDAQAVACRLRGFGLGVVELGGLGGFHQLDLLGVDAVVDEALAKLRGRFKLPEGVTTDDVMRELRGRAPGDPVEP